MATLGTNKAYRRKTAVAAVLGGDMVDQIRRTGAGGPAYSATAPRDRADVDVQLLLKGAERLSEVYSVPGAAEKIMSLRTRYGQLTASISHHEARVSKQTAQLDRLNKPQDYDGDDDDDLSPEQDVDVENEPDITEEDIRREEDELKELERKKKGLEERVSGMERDLGGLLR
ncbi:MAG: hypothetical protein M1817_006693 [Caeruleum heppii]|nr:MAG: hypothetical protein M1817_006693 [Caeruleum heppii]